MQIVAVDILGSFPESTSGNCYIMLVMDYLTRWTEAYAIPNQESATVVDQLLSNCSLRFSPPEQLYSNQSRQFEASLLQEICRCLGIHKTHTTPYRLQGDKLVEHFNRTLLNKLTTTAKDHPTTWDTFLSKLCMAYNTSVQASTRYTPFYLMLGRESRLPVDIIFGPPPADSTSPNEHAAQLQVSVCQAFQALRKNMATAHKWQKEHYNRHVHGKAFQQNDLVLLLNSAVSLGHSHKLHCPSTVP